MSYVTSAIQFGNYIFPSGFRIAQGDQAASLDEIDLLGVDGIHAPSAFAGAQTVTVEGELGGGGDVDSSGSVLATPDEVNNELNLLAQQLRLGLGQLVAGWTPARYLICQQKDNFTRTFEAGFGRRHAAVKLLLSAPDPRWLSAAQHTVTANGAVTNLGTAKSYPLLTITGPAVNPALTIYPNASSPTGPHVELNFAVTLGSSDHLVVNCDPRQRQLGILLNGVVAMYVLGTTGVINTIGTADTFPFIAGGQGGAVQSYVRVDNVTGSWSLVFQDAWWL
jgi:hypothetical protein